MIWTHADYLQFCRKGITEFNHPQRSKPDCTATRIMASIGIIGLGNWGTALAKVWGSTGHNIIGWTIEEELCINY